MNKTIINRLEALRTSMKREGIAAYIIPSADAHLSEYTPERWTGRTWISGFTGSAGTMLVTLSGAYLWTDSRYFIQAADELQGTTIELMKMGQPDVPSIEDFISTELSSGSIVAADGACISYAEAKDTADSLANFGINYRLDTDLLNEVWTDRPNIPSKELFLQPSEYSGQTAADRIKLVREKLRTKGANATLITMLCELAWVFNIRGYDVEYNPVAVGFGYISQEEAVLFVLPEKLTDEVRSSLLNNGVRLAHYSDIGAFVSALPTTTKLYIDPRRLTHRLYTYIPSHCKLIQGVSILTSLKAVKTPTELEGVRRAMVRDGVSLTRFFIWLENLLNSGGSISEYNLGLKLNEFRRKGGHFYGDSFGTIAGYLGHGAIVHYKAEPTTSYEIKSEGVLLLDSGGQYFDGTTDITRTLALSPPSDQLRTDYTLVLKGHIAIATAQFPEGTRGSQIDILARKALWDKGMNYGHGTGHGVGYFLNVHEGPQNIRTEVNPTPLEIGMITSNEPGLYRANEYGIRIENLIVTELKAETPFGRFLGFETVTLCYLDNSLVDKTLLSADEIAWYNSYQERVYQSLSPHLTETEAAWLRAKTEAI
ncbi:MAG: aminopeptidase P family protein [Porphyromonadaceae bacterium]|nr:aminopeptidase P family protein [Porphyromonadaceae bacterium]